MDYVLSRFEQERGCEMNTPEVGNCKDDDFKLSAIRDIAVEILRDISDYINENYKDEIINSVVMDHDSIIVFINMDSI